MLILYIIKTYDSSNSYDIVLLNSKSLSYNDLFNQCFLESKTKILYLYHTNMPYKSSLLDRGPDGKEPPGLSAYIAV